MKSLLLGAAMLAGAIPALAQTSVSISVGQPGFYGRIDIGDFARPQVIYADPVVVHPHRHHAAQPVYLLVPPGHRKNWKKHCARYDACGQKVFFVRDEWYANTYAPRYRERHGGHHGELRQMKHERGPDRGDEHGHGNGNGHGNGHGKGKGH